MAQYTQINPDALVTALTPINNSLGGKQDKTDNTLATTDKTISGAINEINTKVGNLTGALTWKGKFDTLPAVTDYEAGNVVGVGNKEYVLTVTGSTKAWEELGDEGSYLLKSVAEETYLKKAAGEVATANIADGAVISTKLATGARRPIILTIDTTEVDEETYQKLLSDDVDVIFKVEGGELCILTYKHDNKDYLALYFTCLSVEGSVIDYSLLYAYEVDITKTSPHTCSISENFVGSFVDFINEAGYLTEAGLKPIFNPILKEIDLTGTDADRKAKLDQFAADWKYLTGADTLDGARFVGLYTGRDNHDRTALFVHRFSQDPSMEIYEGISMNSDDGYSNISKNMNEKVSVDGFNGSITITPLFSHLEAITIKTSNSDTDMSANVTAITEYVENLIALGVDCAKGFNVPVKIGNFYGCLTGNYITGSGCFLSGTIFSATGGGSYIKDIYINPMGRYSELVNIKNDNDLNTTSKDLIDAINEVNTLAKSKGNGTITGVKMNGVSKGTSGVVDLGTVLTAHQDISGKVDKTLNAKAFEAITIRTTNSAADKAANVEAIKAYVNNLKTLGVDTTKILSIPVKMGIDSIGNLMYRDIGNYFSLTGMVFGFNDMEINYVYIDNDGGYSKFLGVYDEDGLETVRKNIVGAINEVNTLAKSKGNGTITGVKMNGVSKGTSGVVDLGTVLTAHQDISGKQDKLVSGTNIKTINGESVLGSGDIAISSNVMAVDTGDIINDATIEYTTKSYVDGLVGDINNVLESIING